MSHLVIYSNDLNRTIQSQYPILQLSNDIETKNPVFVIYRNKPEPEKTRIPT